ncbi:MAG: nucleotidyltransferase domain-containing protein [Nitrospinae bacterium]|nr:nucleotidyltransferase domain-containing protein [Nitrospinota bacterium]
MITSSNIEALKHYFETRKDIAFAFLFGSQARGTATKLSDVDIAIYFYPLIETFRDKPEKRRPMA